MPVSKRLRYEILRRDNHACRYCGASAPNVPLVVDHVLPVALGGQDDSSNLLTACRDCNAGKSSSSPDSTLVEEVAQRAIDWAAAMRQVAEERAAERLSRDYARRAVSDMWNGWTWTDYTGERHNFEMASDWKSSVDSFYAAGLWFDDFEELIEAAMTCKTTKDKWRYFCGCCWTRIRQIQDRAAQIIAESGN